MHRTVCSVPTHVKQKHNVLGKMVSDVWNVFPRVAEAELKGLQHDHHDDGEKQVGQDNSHNIGIFISAWVGFLAETLWKHLDPSAIKLAELLHDLLPDDGAALEVDEFRALTPLFTDVTLELLNKGDVEYVMCLRAR